MLARAALVMVAVVVIAWLGVMERNLRLTDSGSTAAYTLRTKGNIARAERDLRAARLLNPDTRTDLVRSYVLFASGEHTRARALVQGVLDREPDNYPAWLAMWNIGKRTEPALARRALAELARLNPLQARAASG